MGNIVGCNKCLCLAPKGEYFDYRNEPRPKGRHPCDVEFNTQTGDIATFSLGCFIEADARFGVLPGVIRTRVGYTGGRTLDPTYDFICDYAEAIDVEFDPSQITYVELLETFWKSHDPSLPIKDQRYRSAIYYHSKEQKYLAELSLNYAQRAFYRKLQTKICPITAFYLAEDMHQHAYLRQRGDILAEIGVNADVSEEMTCSHVAARLNGYLGGYANPQEIEQEIPHFHLSSRLEQEFRAIKFGRPVDKMQIKFEPSKCACGVK